MSYRAVSTLFSVPKELSGANVVVTVHAHAIQADPDYACSGSNQREVSMPGKFTYSIIIVSSCQIPFVNLSIVVLQLVTDGKMWKW